MQAQLATYLETGELPRMGTLTDAQRAAIVHAGADESSAELAGRIGADFFTVQRYRAKVQGLASTKLHWRTCSDCGARFVSRHVARVACDLCDWKRRVPRNSCPVYFPVCLECGEQFCTRSGRQLMHAECRAKMERRVEVVTAA